MKRRMTLSLVLTLSVLLSLVSLPSRAQGAPAPRFSARSGVVTLNTDQMLRVTVVPTGNDTIRVRIKWMKYMAVGCSSGTPPVCRHTVESQGETETETVGPGEAISVDVQGGAPVNVMVESNKQDVQVNAMIIDPTGAIVSSSCLLNKNPDLDR
jgi:hypothetical protein